MTVIRNSEEPFKKLESVSTGTSTGGDLSNPYITAQLSWFFRSELRNYPVWLISGGFTVP
jgi:hypothetical protein